MYLIHPQVEVEKCDYIRKMRLLEFFGRICYKTEGKVTEDSYQKFLPDKVAKGHQSIIEHEKISAIATVSRAISHELVRHRIASYSQESQRYCDYNKKGIAFIVPFYFMDNASMYNIWRSQCKEQEKAYQALRELGAPPEQAREVLGNSAKTEIVFTFNMREWIHFFTVRCSSAAHPAMRQFTIPLLLHFQKHMPELFNHIPYDKNFPSEHYATIIEVDFLEE